MPEIAFTAEAMDACARTRHQWRWVPTWGRIGFRECWRCGATGPVGPVELVGGGATSESPPPAEPVIEPDIAPDTTPDVPAPPPASALRGRSPTETERNHELVQLRSAGESVLAIAKRFGISDARVYQILRRAKCQEEP